MNGVVFLQITSQTAVTSLNLGIEGKQKSYWKRYYQVRKSRMVWRTVGAGKHRRRVRRREYYYVTRTQDMKKNKSIINFKSLIHRFQGG